MELRVSSAHIIERGLLSYAIYTLECEADGRKSSVVRRFSEFEALAEELKRLGLECVHCLQPRSECAG